MFECVGNAVGNERLTVGSRSAAPSACCMRGRERADLRGLRRQCTSREGCGIRVKSYEEMKENACKSKKRMCEVALGARD